MKNILNLGCFRSKLATIIAEICSVHTCEWKKKKTGHYYCWYMLQSVHTFILNSFPTTLANIYIYIYIISNKRQILICRHVHTHYLMNLLCTSYFIFNLIIEANLTSKREEGLCLYYEVGLLHYLLLHHHCPGQLLCNLCRMFWSTSLTKLMNLNPEPKTYLFIYFSKDAF